MPSRAHRILHILPVLTRGGAELQLCALAESQAETGHNVTVACVRSSRELRSRLEASQVRVLDGSTERWRLPGALLRAARDASVVHAWMYHGFLVAALLRPSTRATHIWAVRRTSPDSPGLTRRTRLVIRVSKQLSQRCADGLIYVSHSAQRAHEEFGFGSPQATVIYNAVSIDSSGTPHAGTASPKRFGFLGRWNRDKGVDLLLQAWALERNALAGTQLVLAGPGLDSDNRELMADIGRLHLHGTTVLTGPVDDAAEFLRSLDCLVSASRTEGFPNVIAEALALGVPVIATRVGGTPEVVGDCATTVEVNARAIASAIIAFQADPTDLRRRAARGPERVAEQFSLAETARRTVEFYDSVSRRAI